MPEGFLFSLPLSFYLSSSSLSLLQSILFTSKRLGTRSRESHDACNENPKDHGGNIGFPLTSADNWVEKKRSQEEEKEKSLATTSERASFLAEVVFVAAAGSERSAAMRKSTSLVSNRSTDH